VFSKLVPGDTFGMRTLLPQEEIEKRVQVDPEDAKKVALTRMISKGTISKKLVSYQVIKEPIFNQ
jgi:hypothetical protein